MMRYILKGVLRVILRYFFLFLNESICCGLSLDSPQQDGSNDGLQHIFDRTDMEIHP